MRPWLTAERIDSARLTLEPLREQHAEEMSVLLASEALHEYTGGSPETAAELRVRYRRQAVGHSPDDAEGWLNWVARTRKSGAAIGTVQATLTEDPDDGGAEIAWTVGSQHQGLGYASEAAAAMVDWLRGHGYPRVSALIHPQHEASMAVARRLGLRATSDAVDGEIRWTWPSGHGKGNPG